MRVTAATAAAILAITVASAGADGDVAAGSVPDFYHDNAAYIDKRDTGGDGWGNGPPSGRGWGGGGFFGGDKKPAGGGWSGPPGGGDSKGHGPMNEHDGWGPASHQKREDTNSAAATAIAPSATADADDSDEYAGIACNCFQDPTDKDAAGLPTIRCGCFHTGQGSAATGTDDAARKIGKRGKVGFSDIVHDWDWWQNQGTSDWPMTWGGNPNIPVRDWKYDVMANVGGYKKRGEEDAPRDKGPPGKARPITGHWPAPPLENLA